MVIKSFTNLTSQHLAFLTLCFVYGLWSSMIPTSFGLPELFLVVLLTMIVPVLGLIQGLFPTSIRNQFHVPNSLSLVVLLMLILPLATGLIRQNDFVDILRDVVPFMFFLLPVFMYRTLQRSPNVWISVMAIGYSIIGILMTLRHFSEAGASFSDVGQRSIFGTGISLAFDPAIQFAFPFLFGIAIKLLLEKKYILASCLAAVSLVPLFAILGVVARAPLVLSFFSIALMMYFGFRSRLLNIIVLTGFCVLLTITLASENVISRSADLMLLKQEKYGVSSRDLEVAAVLNNADTIDTILFGEGWGGLISNPIGDGAMWSFVHNMYAYYFFKQGLVGLVGVLIYTYWLLMLFLRSFNRLRSVGGGVRLIALLSLIPPFAGSLMLEVTYKTLMFGFLLSLLVAISASIKSEGGK